ncbi:hypothetical protein AAHA92_15165 [Salvia divinorum]|uniref:Uncharacterized protein n=1 Tax=Salvia divinorum TaxID=28513 RepID=A0ABD1HHV4_SALDI
MMKLEDSKKLEMVEIRPLQQQSPEHHGIIDYAATKRDDVRRALQSAQVSPNTNIIHIRWRELKRSRHSNLTLQSEHNQLADEQEIQVLPKLDTMLLLGHTG